MMPVEIPDARVHEHCIKCKQWFEPEDGEYINIRAGGPMSQMQQFGDMCMGKERGKRFICLQCKARRDRFRKGLAIFIIGLGLIVALAGMGFAMFYMTSYNV